MNTDNTAIKIDNQLPDQLDGFAELAGLELAYLGGGSGDIVWI